MNFLKHLYISLLIAMVVFSVPKVHSQSNSQSGCSITINDGREVYIDQEFNIKVENIIYRDVPYFSNKNSNLFSGIAFEILGTGTRFTLSSFTEQYQEPVRPPLIQTGEPFYLLPAISSPRANRADLFNLELRPNTNYTFVIKVGNETLCQRTMSVTESCRVSTTAYKIDNDTYKIGITVYSPKLSPFVRYAIDAPGRICSYSSQTQTTTLCRETNGSNPISNSWDTWRIDTENISINKSGDQYKTGDEYQVRVLPVDSIGIYGLSAVNGCSATGRFEYTASPAPSNGAPLPQPSPPAANNEEEQEFNSYSIGDTCYDGETKGIETSLGCIPTNPSELFAAILRLAIGLAGGIAFLLIILGGVRILASAGNPEALNQGREIVTSAIAGLILIIFSVFILKFIGYDILRIPGFGTTPNSTPTISPSVSPVQTIPRTAVPGFSDIQPQTSPSSAPAPSRPAYSCNSAAPPARCNGGYGLYSCSRLMDGTYVGGWVECPCDTNTNRCLDLPIMRPPN